MRFPATSYLDPLHAVSASQLCLLHTLPLMRIMHMHGLLHIHIVQLHEFVPEASRCITKIAEEEMCVILLLRTRHDATKCVMAASIQFTRSISSTTYFCQRKCYKLKLILYPLSLTNPVIWQRFKFEVMF